MPELRFASHCACGGKVTHQYLTLGDPQDAEWYGLGGGPRDVDDAVMVCASCAARLPVDRDHVLQAVRRG